MSYHDHDSGNGFHGRGRFAGVERLVPEIHEPVEMPQGVESVAQAQAPDNNDIRLARIPGEVTPIGAVGIENSRRTTVVTTLVGLATLAGVRARG